MAKLRASIMRSSVKFVQKLAGTAEPSARLTQQTSLPHNICSVFFLIEDGLMLLTLNITLTAGLI